MPLPRIWLACAWVLLFRGTFMLAESYSDDFESYPDTATMMLPGNWGDSGGSPFASLWPAPNGNPGQAMWHTGYEPAKHVLSSALVPTDEQPIVWEFDFYDDGVSSKRMSGGLRDNGTGGDPTAILEMGVGNSLHPETGGQPHSYAIRTVFIGGDPVGLGGWVAFVENPAQIAGWHHFKATIGASEILFELDLFDDGTIDGTRLVATAAGAGIAYDVLRLGSWGVSSPTGAGFDNVSISKVSGPAIPADFDDDGDVDLTDYDTFLGCYNGPNNPPVQSGCEAADFDNDNDVDLGDYGVFLGCYNGPNKPPGC